MEGSRYVNEMCMHKRRKFSTNSTSRRYTPVGTGRYSQGYVCIDERLSTGENDYILSAGDMKVSDIIPVSLV